MNTITVDVSALRAWAESISTDAEAETQKQINLALKNSANIVQRLEAAEMPRGVTGKMAATLMQTITEDAAIVEPDPELLYPLFVYLGTRPHMPPVDAITAWANSKGINPWALAMSIKQKGTKSNDYVDRAFASAEIPVQEEFGFAAGAIAEFLAEL
jgi:hypothetical protein